MDELIGRSGLKSVNLKIC